VASRVACSCRRVLYEILCDLSFFDRVVVVDGRVAVEAAVLPCHEVGFGGKSCDQAPESAAADVGLAAEGTAFRAAQHTSLAKDPWVFAGEVRGSQEVLKIEVRRTETAKESAMSSEQILHRLLPLSGLRSRSCKLA